MMSMQELAERARQVQSSPRLLTVQKNEVLMKVAQLVREREGAILQANSEDQRLASAGGRDSAFLDRLALDADRVEQLAHGLEQVARLPDPVGTMLTDKVLENGVRLCKRRVPLGVTLVIYEARPGVTLDAAALCFKSGNAVILKGGREAMGTNRLLAAILCKGIVSIGVDPAWVQFVDSIERSDTLELLRQDQFIDVVIPRGGYDLVQTVVRESRIPALYHAAGMDHLYIDQSAEVELAVAVCLNSKVNRPATCNAVETLLVHAGVAERVLPRLIAALQNAGVQVKGDSRVRGVVPEVELAEAADYDHEYLSLGINLAVVDSVETATAHIAAHGSRHTEGIIATDQAVIDRFCAAVDAAAICINCSTRLHDGGVFGLGAEMGIATGKLHARGPVGLEELCSYQWVLHGEGQVRG